MSKEWQGMSEWSAPSEDYGMPVEDVMTTGCEIVAPCIECVKPLDEFIEPAEEYNNLVGKTTEDALKTENAGEKEQNHSRKKRLRKMLYGITSMAMVVSLGTSIAKTEIADTLSKQNVWFSIYDRNENYAKAGIITVGGQDTIGGVGHVSREYRYVDYEGNPLELETTKRIGYMGKWINSYGYV